MSKLKKNIIMLGVLLAVGLGAFTYGSMSSNADQAKQWDYNTRSQMMAEQKFGNQLNADRFVKAIQQDTELTLVTENGIASMDIDKFADGWNKWFTGSSISMSLEYKAKVSVKTSDITFIPKDDDGLVVVIDKNDIEVSSVEIVNKNILLGRAIFGQGWSEDEKTVLEKQMIQQVKEKILADNDVMTEVENSLHTYLNNLGNTFDVSLNIIYK